MTALPRIACVAALCLAVSASPAAEPDFTAALLVDDLSSLKPGLFSAGVIGAQAEYHYIPTVAPKGNWVVSTFRSDPSQRAWRIIREEGRHLFWQSYAAPPQERPYQHPMVIAGDALWQDYRLETSFTPDEGPGISGVLVRYRDDRHYYFVGLSDQRAIIRKTDGGNGFRTLNETVLAEKPLPWKPGAPLQVVVTATGPRLEATIGGVALSASDDTFTQGKIGFTSDMPTKFAGVRVTTSAAEQQRFEIARRGREAEENQLVAANPTLKVWRKFRTPSFGVSRNVRFGDLNGDGELDVLICQMKRHGPGDGHSEVGCLTALDLHGNMLWQIGTPDSWAHTLTNDVAFQIHDLDGDGKNEVVYCKDLEIVVAEGATGKTKYKASTPPTPPDPLRPDQALRFPRILGDALTFADFRGAGRATDLVIKNRYRNIWAFNARLEPLWSRALNTGHYPFPFDLNGDGRDELAVGYAVLGSDGAVLWNHEDKIKDHADGVAWVSLKPGAPPTLLCNASDEGMLFIARDGKILKHYQVGHVQNVSIADYRPDLPGLESVAINFWANQGIVTMFNADMEIYHSFEPCQHGSALQPINWTGKAQEYWVLSANSEEGGMFDGWGRRVVRFPADGHPDLCSFVLDVTGDARDEVIVWDPYEMWIYTQSDGPLPGKIYKPKRNPLYNTSNYETTYSLPGWSE